MRRASITSRLGISVFDQAKSAEVPYSEVRRKAERPWPLWTKVAVNPDHLGARACCA